MFRTITNMIKNTINHSRNDTFHFGIMYIGPLHRECLSWRCLSICKYSAIEPFQHTVNHWSGCIIEQIDLSGLHGKYAVQRKPMILFIRVDAFYGLGVTEFQTFKIISLLFWGVEWPDPTHDSDIACVFLLLFLHYFFIIIEYPCTIYPLIPHIIYSSPFIL